MNVRGTIKKICPLITGIKDGKEWRKLVFAIDIKDGEYTNTMAFELFGDDKIQLLNSVVGDEIDVYFNIRSNEWNDKYFTSLPAWKIDVVNSVTSEQTEETPPPITEDDDLPF